MSGDGKNAITPLHARLILDDQLSAFGYDPATRAGLFDDDSLYFDDSALSAWPYYEAMLDAARTPAEVAWVGWQLISYYILDAERLWMDRGSSLVPAIAQSAARSPRLGAFLSEWLTFHLSDVSPAAAVLAAEILSHRYSWQIYDDVRRIRASLSGVPGSPSYLIPRSDFSEVSVRAAIVWSFAPTSISMPFPPSSARVRWETANAGTVVPADSSCSNLGIMQALRWTCAPQNQGQADCAAERVIVRLLDGEIGQVSRNPIIASTLADVLGTIGQVRGTLAWRALDLLLRQPFVGDTVGSSDRSTWRALRDAER